jgi:hypothetical protein
MAIDNMISLTLSADELKKLDNALAAIEEVINGKFISLTPTERLSHGRVSDKTEDWIGKVKESMEQNPSLVLSHIDVNEYNNDYAARRILMSRINRVERIYHLFEDTNMLLGSDLYHNAITFYKGLKASAETDAPGAKTVYSNLAARFPGRPSSLKDASTQQ